MPNPDNIHFTQEARRRMGQRRIYPSDVRAVLSQGRILRHYPEDNNSYLMLGRVSGTYGRDRPVHVVAADHEDTTVVITTYEPEPALWEDNFRWKKEWTSEKNTWRET